MQINMLQNYNYMSNKNQNSASLNRSPSFGDLHYSQSLRNYCRSNGISINTLTEAKNNTKPISNKIFNSWLEHVNEKMFQQSHRSDIVHEVCSAISKELYGVEDNKEIMALAQCEQLEDIFNLHANELKMEATEIFNGAGRDFDYDVDDVAASRDCYPRINYKVPGFCTMFYNYTMGNKSYGITNSLRHLKNASPGIMTFKDIPEDSSPECVKKLFDIANKIKQEYRGAIEEVIRPMAEQIIANDEYEKLK